VVLGNLGSRVFMISSAFFAEIFFNTRSTLSLALAFWNRSMIVVAVKSVRGQRKRTNEGAWLASSRGSVSKLESLTSESFFVPTEVLERGSTSVQRLDADRGEGFKYRSAAAPTLQIAW